jgi:hypothetical protein
MTAPLIDHVHLALSDVVDVLTLTRAMQGEGTGTDEFVVKVTQNNWLGIVGQEGGPGVQQGCDGVVTATARRTTLYCEWKCL